VLALIAGIMEAVPNIGPIIAAVPAILIAALYSPWQALFVAILYLVIQQLENYVFFPLILGRTVGLHPLWILLSILTGGLLLGIIGVILFRAILIGLGAALIASFNWILFIFGAFLVFTGVRMFTHTDEAAHIEDNPLLKWLRGHVPITNELHGRHFAVRQHNPKAGRVTWFLTPLAVALILVEFVDLIFAVDSVPAVFAVTQDTFIVYTSNIFAILGLRALYFALAAAMNRFRYLQISLAIILVLIGIKIFLVPLHIHVDTLLSLIVTLAILGGGVAFSLWRTRNEPPVEEEAESREGEPREALR
jgi:tellurite resistance protein TerC